MTATERAAHSARLREAWAGGRFATRRKPRHPRAWSAYEQARLRELLGTLTLAEIAEALSRETALPRTETAVIVRCQRLGLSRSPAALTARQVGQLFGVDPKTITHSWTARGWLSGRQMRDLPGSSWLFETEQVEAFIRTHPNVYDWQAMRPGRWRSLAEVVWQSDPLLTMKQAAVALGASRSTLIAHCAKGWLPSLRRFEQGGAQSGRLLIRRSDLGCFRYRRPELVGVSGRKGRGA